MLSLVVSMKVLHRFRAGLFPTIHSEIFTLRMLAVISPEHKNVWVMATWQVQYKPSQALEPLESRLQLSQTANSLSCTKASELPFEIPLGTSLQIRMGHILIFAPATRCEYNLILDACSKIHVTRRSWRDEVLAHSDPSSQMSSSQGSQFTMFTKVRVISRYIECCFSFHSSWWGFNATDSFTSCCACAIIQGCPWAPMALTSLRALRSSIAIEACPLSAAMCRGWFPSWFLEWTWAPDWSRISTALLQPDITARCRGSAPVSSLTAWFACFSKRKLITGPWPCLAARCSGRLWCWLSVSMLHRHLSNWRTTFTWPRSAAACNGVRPSRSRAKCAPGTACVMLRRSFTALTWPPAAAMWNATRWSPSGISGSAPVMRKGGSKCGPEALDWIGTAQIERE